MKSRSLGNGFYFAILLFIAILTVACSQPIPEAGHFEASCDYQVDPSGSILLNCKPTGIVLPTVEATPTNLVVTDIPAPTATATSQPTLSPTSVPPVLINGNFETKPPIGYVRPVYGLPEINIMQGWWPYFCARPYTAQDCAIPREWNPYTTYLKRPEYKPANPDQDCAGPNQYANRVKRGCNAQQFFAFYGVMDAGVHQTINTLVPGATYEFSVWVQLWSAENAKGGCVGRDTSNRCVDWSSDPYTSDVASQDDRTAINARAGVDLSCGTNAYSSSVVWTRDYSHADGFYDHWGQIKIRFTAITNCATVFVGGYNKYGKAHNDIFVDDARLVAVP